MTLLPYLKSKLKFEQLKFICGLRKNVPLRSPAPEKGKSLGMGELGESWAGEWDWVVRQTRTPVLAVAEAAEGGCREGRMGAHSCSLCLAGLSGLLGESPQGWPAQPLRKWQRGGGSLAGHSWLPAYASSSPEETLEDYPQPRVE